MINVSAPDQHARSLRLRRWAIGDAPTVLLAFAAEDMTHQRDRPIETLDDARRWIANTLDNHESGSGHNWAVEAASGVVGSAAVTAIDPVHETGWVSYWTLPDVRGQGLASEGLRLLADWCFDVLGLFRLELGHRVNNPASCRVALQAGFQVEGLERQKLKYGAERFDVELHARLRTD